MKKSNVRLKKTIIYLLICSFVLISYPLTVSASNFSDVPNDYWAKEYIDFVVERGIMSGTTDTTFSPSTNINRGQFALCLSKCLGIILENNINTGFSDVPTNKYYAGAVKWAAENSLIDPTTSSTFTPSSAITRAHVANAMAKYSDKYGLLTRTKSHNYTPNDCSSLNSSLQTNIRNAIKWGFMSLDANNSFNPNGYVTRAHAAVIFTNLYDYYVTVPISYIYGSSAHKWSNYYNGKIHLPWYYGDISQSDYPISCVADAMEYYDYSGYAYVHRVYDEDYSLIIHSQLDPQKWFEYTGEAGPEMAYLFAFTLPINTDGESIDRTTSNKNIAGAYIYYSPYIVPDDPDEPSKTITYRRNTVAHEVFHALGFDHINADIRLSIVNYGEYAPRIDTLTGLLQYDYYALNEHYN